MLITESERRLSKVLDVYEQRLAESKFLAGDEFSLADLSHLPNSHYLARSKKWSYLFESRENVSKWWENISSRHSWQEVVKILNKVGLLKEGTVTSNSGYQFLVPKRLDLHKPAKSAPQTAAFDHIQKEELMPQLTGQAAATGVPSSPLEGQKEQLSHQEGSTGKSITQPAVNNAQPPLKAEPTGKPVPQPQQDAPSFPKLSTDSTLNRTQGQQQQQPKQLPTEQGTTSAAATAAPPSQTQSEQQAHRGDPVDQSPPERITPGTQSSVQPPVSPASKDQEKHTEQMKQADTLGRPAEQEVQTNAASSTSASQKKENNFETFGRADSSSPKTEQKAPTNGESARLQPNGQVTDQRDSLVSPSQEVVTNDQPTTEQSAAPSSQTAAKQGEIAPPIQIGQSMPQQQATPEEKSPKKQLTPGAPFNPEGEENTKEKMQSDSSAASDKQGLVDSQSSAQQGQPESKSDQKVETRGEKIDQEDQAGKTVSEGLQFSHLPQPPTNTGSGLSTQSGAQSGPQQEQISDQASDNKSVHSGQSKVQPTLDQDPNSMKKQEEDGQSSTEEEKKGTSDSQEASGEAQSFPKDQPSQNQEQAVTEASQESSTAKSDADLGPKNGNISKQGSPTSPSEKPEEKAQAINQANSTASGEAQSFPKDQPSQSPEQAPTQTSPQSSSAKTDADLGPKNGNISKQGSATSPSEKPEEKAQAMQADSSGKTDEQQGAADGKSSNSSTSTESATEKDTEGTSSNQSGSST